MTRIVRYSAAGAMSLLLLVSCGCVRDDRLAGPQGMGTIVRIEEPRPERQRRFWQSNARQEPAAELKNLVNYIVGQRRSRVVSYSPDATQARVPYSPWLLVYGCGEGLETWPKSPGFLGTFCSDGSLDIQVLKSS